MHLKTLTFYFLKYVDVALFDNSNVVDVAVQFDVVIPIDQQQWAVFAINQRKYIKLLILFFSLSHFNYNCFYVVHLDYYRVINPFVSN